MRGQPIDVELVTRGRVCLVLGRARQLRSFRRKWPERIGARGSRVTRRVMWTHGNANEATKVLIEMAVRVGARTGKGKVSVRCVNEVRLRSLDRRRSRILDDRERVDAEKRELRPAPPLPEHIAIQRQCLFEPSCLPADFIVRQSVGLIRRNDLVAGIDMGSPIEPPRSEASRIGGVHHGVVVDLIFDGRFVRFTAAADLLVEVYARAAMQGGWPSHTAWALANASVAAEHLIETEEPF